MPALEEEVAWIFIASGASGSSESLGDADSSDALWRVRDRMVLAAGTILGENKQKTSGSSLKRCETSTGECSLAACLEPSLLARQVSFSPELVLVN